ncbi:hypothetical protein T458_26840 [Brevibacillus panacihumi W25]|uniref:Transposase n=1 Tax=Brevibacillus panacihumi W25 TaxID=1408254 RepID=V6MA38_9BACL|nr:hypothetical protein T458_26840 [Brevibacillus panacihumi W25]
MIHDNFTKPEIDKEKLDVIASIIFQLLYQNGIQSIELIKEDQHHVA